MPKHLTATDRVHLAHFRDYMQWAEIAAIHQALDWRWEEMPHRPPTAAELRRHALRSLAGYIRRARSCRAKAAEGKHRHFVYQALLNRRTKELERLVLVFSSHAEATVTEGSARPSTPPDMSLPEPVAITECAAQA